MPAGSHPSPAAFPGAAATPRRRFHERLTALVERLAAAGDPDGTPTLAVGVAGLRHDDLGEVHLHPLPTADPVTALVGFVAPLGWSAFGVVGPASVRSVVSTAGPTARHRPASGDLATVAHIVARSGFSATALGRPGTSPTVDRSHAPALGRSADVCRRALVLPTAPAEGSSLELHALRWVERVLARALVTAGAGTSLSWSEVVACHPAVSPATVIGPATAVSPATVIGPATGAGESSWPAPTVGEVIERARAHARVWTWERTRAACARRAIAVDGLVPEAAAWMDAGTFARWAVRLFPPVGDVLDSLDHLLAPPGAAHTRATVAALGLGDRAPGDSAEAGR